MANSPEEDPENGPGILVLIVVLVLFAFGCAWLFIRLKSGSEALTCLASGRRNCDRIEQ